MHPGALQNYFTHSSVRGRCRVYGFRLQQQQRNVNKGWEIRSRRRVVSSLNAALSLLNRDGVREHDNALCLEGFCLDVQQERREGGWGER